MKLAEGTRIISRSDLFDSLPDEIVILILCKLASTASSPLDFVTVLLTCKRLNTLGVNRLVLSNAGPETLAVRAKNWCDEAHRFLKLCIHAGNKEALYILGMILFYCVQNRESGASLMAKAGIKLHTPALYSLALIQFNGSGGMKNDKDLPAGVALCERAAFLGHVDALRELGHCLQDGYGVPKKVEEGHYLIRQANVRELASILCTFDDTPFSSVSPPSIACEFHSHQQRPDLTDSYERESPCPPISSLRLLNRYWSNVPEERPHPANRFLVEWFNLRIGGIPGLGLRMCSNERCGRPETRKNEFRKCSGCGKVNYCSRGCQAYDWRLHHKVECAPIDD
ncbi:putative F-box protein [Helianthus debilis subsp. tardiflorus]